MSAFFHAVPITLIPLLQTFVIAFIGAGLMKARALTADGLDVLAKLIMQLFLPLMIFTNIVSNFRPGSAEYAGWYLMPLLAIGTISLVLILSIYPTRWICHPDRQRPFHLLAGFQNAGYIPIVIVSALYPATPEAMHIRNRMLVLLFLYVMGQNPLLWYVGVVVSRRTTNQPNAPKPTWWALVQQGFSPPLMASVVSILLCLLRVPQSLPPAYLEKVLAPLNTLSSCTVPMVMLVLGAMIASIKAGSRPPRHEIASLVILRLVLLPLFYLLLLEGMLHWGWLTRAFAVILFIESLTPSATNIGVMMRRYGSAQASEFVSHALMHSYLWSMVSMPFWLTLWSLRSGFSV